MEVFVNLPADLPKHAPTPIEPCPSRVMTTWPLGTFIENLLIRANGEIVVSVHSENRLDRVLPDGTRQTLAALPGPPTSLFEVQEELFAFGGAPGQSPGMLWHLDAEGHTEVRAELADALFLNGSAPFLPGSVLVVDSLQGVIFQVEIQTGKSVLWFAHELLTKITTFPLMPGGNGLRLFRRHVYVSNTDRAILVRIAVQPDGSAGEIETVAEGLRADDFVFDAAGNAYLTTHIENTLVRLAPDGTRVALAGPEQGMPGCTAARFGRTAEIAGTLFVTTTGGLIGPYQGVAQEAKLVCLEVGVTGAPIEFLEG